MRASSTLKTYTDFTVDARVRAGIAAAAKVVMMMHIQGKNFCSRISSDLLPELNFLFAESCTQLSDRAGTQGLYRHNQIINIQVRPPVNGCEMQTHP